MSQIVLRGDASANKNNQNTTPAGDMQTPTIIKSNNDHTSSATPLTGPMDSVILPQYPSHQQISKINSLASSIGSPVREKRNTEERTPQKVVYINRSGLKERARSNIQQRFDQIAKLYHADLSEYKSEPVNILTFKNERPAYPSPNIPQSGKKIKTKSKKQTEGSPNPGGKNLGTIVFSPYRKLLRQTGDKTSLSPRKTSSGIINNNREKSPVPNKDSSKDLNNSRSNSRELSRQKSKSSKVNLSSHPSRGRIGTPNQYPSTAELEKSQVKDISDAGKIIAKIKKKIIGSSSAKKNNESLPIIEQSDIKLPIKKMILERSPRELPPLRSTPPEKKDRAHSFTKPFDSRRELNIEDQDIKPRTQRFSFLVTPNVDSFSNSQRSDNEAPGSADNRIKSFASNLGTEGNVDEEDEVRKPRSLTEPDGIGDKNEQNEAPQSDRKFFGPTQTKSSQFLEPSAALKNRIIKGNQHLLRKPQTISHVSSGIYQSASSEDRDQNKAVHLEVPVDYKSMGGHRSSAFYERRKDSAVENANLRKAQTDVKGSQLTAEQRYEILMKTNIEDKFSQIFRTMRSRSNKKTKRVQFSSELID